MESKTTTSSLCESPETTADAAAAEMSEKRRPWKRSRRPAPWQGQAIVRRTHAFTLTAHTLMFFTRWNVSVSFHNACPFRIISSPAGERSRSPARIVSYRGVISCTDLEQRLRVSMAPHIRSRAYASFQGTDFEQWLGISMKPHPRSRAYVSFHCTDLEQRLQVLDKGSVGRDEAQPAWISSSTMHDLVLFKYRPEYSF